MTLLDYLKMDFIQYAIITTIFISLSSALLGVPLVLRRFSFIGDGLSHVAFFAMAIATALKVILKNLPFTITNDMLVIMPITIISAIQRVEMFRRMSARHFLVQVLYSL